MLSSTDPLRLERLLQNRRIRRHRPAGVLNSLLSLIVTCCYAAVVIYFISYSAPLFALYRWFANVIVKIKTHVNPTTGLGPVLPSADALGHVRVHSRARHGPRGGRARLPQLAHVAAHGLPRSHRQSGREAGEPLRRVSGPELVGVSTRAERERCIDFSMQVVVGERLFVFVKRPAHDVCHGTATTPLDACTTALCVFFRAKQPLSLENERRCPRIGNKNLASLARRCPHLTKLDLSDCHGVGSSGLQAVVSHCRRLKVLNLQRCAKLDDGACLVSCALGVHTLGVRWCDGGVSRHSTAIINVGHLIPPCM